MKALSVSGPMRKNKLSIRENGVSTAEDECGISKVYKNQEVS